jgi:hypothetical protein
MPDTPPNNPSTPNEARLLESLKLLKEWGTWLVTIQTAAIAAIGALIADPKPPLTSWEIGFACAAVALFTASIICASYLLVSLPGFYARNASINPAEFGSKPAFIKLWRIDSRSIDVNNLIAGEHAAFVLGVIFFALFIVFKVGRWL